MDNPASGWVGGVMGGPVLPSSAMSQVDMFWRCQVSRGDGGEGWAPRRCVERLGRRARVSGKARERGVWGFPEGQGGGRWSSEDGGERD